MDYVKKVQRTLWWHSTVGTTLLRARPRERRDARWCWGVTPSHGQLTDRRGLPILTLPSRPAPECLTSTPHCRPEDPPPGPDKPTYRLRKGPTSRRKRQRNDRQSSWTRGGKSDGRACRGVVRRDRRLRRRRKFPDRTKLVRVDVGAWDSSRLDPVCRVDVAGKGRRGCP